MKPEDLGTAFPDLAIALGKSARTVPAMLQARAEVSPDAPALWTSGGFSGGLPVTWRQFRDAVACTAHRLRTLGLRCGDRVGILAPSSPDWDIAQLAAMAAGGAVVGLDPHDTAERLAQVVAQCGLTAVFAADDALLAKLVPACGERLRLEVTFAKPASPGTVAFADLATSGAAAAQGSWDCARADDAALIVFTSGTTGEPKGIVYTHEQVYCAVASILSAFPDIEQGSRLACWLPLSNLFQRMINLCAVGRGAQTFYVEDPRSIMQHVRAISPHLFIGVPRFYEKLYAGIQEALDAGPAWRRAVAQWAVRAGERQARSLRGGIPLRPHHRVAAALAERFVLRRIRSVMGTRLRYLISGSAPMPVWLLERFQALGFLVLEAYGMSESIVPVAANRPDHYKFGTVGQALPASDVRVAADGELLLRGPGVFAGYLGEPDSAGRFDAEGFLASGDYASIDGEGFVTLLGRKSEMFKTSTGRRIAPAVIESHLRRIGYVEHAVVFGANRPFLIAVIVASDSALRSRFGDRAVIDEWEAFALRVRSDIAAAVADLANYQRPAGVVLTTQPFSVDAGLITPNLKVRRAAVEFAFRESLDELHRALAGGVAVPLALQRHGGARMLLST